MDGAGFALGIPGFFIACLQILDKVELYKSFGIVSRQLVARFETCKLKLREWADQVGIEDGILKKDHHERLDDPAVARIVQTLLSSIREIFEKAEQTRARSRLSQDQPESYDLPDPESKNDTSKKPTGRAQSRWRGISWAIKRKDQYDGQVEMLEILIEKLYEIVPPGGAVMLPQKTIDRDFFDDNSTQQSKGLGDFHRDLMVQLESMRRSFVQQGHKAIDEWLDVPKPDQHFEKQINDHLAGTCEWIFAHHSYNKWISTNDSNTKARYLWICGPAGHGKSVLCAHVFQSIEKSSVFPCVYFSSASHVQAGGCPDDIVRYWLSHLSRASQVAFNLIWDRLKSTKASRRATSAETWTILRSLVTTQTYVLFFDGLDEYNSSEERGAFLRKLKETTIGTDTRCCIVSRAESDIELELSETGQDTGETLLLECRVTQQAVQADIALYSRKTVTDKLPKKGEALQNELADNMATRCEGMFLWIKLNQGQLRSGKGQKELRNIVNSMPKGLHQSYDRNWTAIQNSSEDRDRAIAILRWVTFSLRPLTVGELAEALVVDCDPENTTFPSDDLPDQLDDDFITDEIKALCSSLIEIRPASDNNLPSLRTIHLAHISVKEYLVANLPIPFSQSISSTKMTQQELQNNYLAKICLQYLCFSDIWSSEEEANSCSDSRHFLKYAVHSWPQHKSSHIEQIEELRALIIKLFATTQSCFEKWAHSFEANALDKSPPNLPPNTSMYYASRFGLTDTMKFLYDQEVSDIDANGRYFGTALQAACASGQHGAFDLLIGWGANLNLVGGEYGTALNAAAASGEVAMATRLIEGGARPALSSDVGMAPLHFACQNGKLKIVQMLLDNGAIWSAETEIGQTPLYNAAANGHLDVVQLLLDKAANASIPQHRGWNPLFVAADNDHIQIVKLLLERGADSSVATASGWTPLNAACDNGCIEIVKLLLDEGADLSLATDVNESPLYHAAQKGHLEIVRYLIDKGADISTASTVQGLTPLHAAIAAGHTDVVRLLLDKGADTATRLRYGTAPLYTAAHLGYSDIVELLLDRGADTSVQNARGKTPLFEAASEGHTKVVELLLRRGTDVSIPSTAPSLGPVATADRTSLHEAASGGYFEIVKMLLDKGADISSKSANGWTPVCLAANAGHTEVVRYLVEKGADFSIKSRTGRTPLHMAAENGHLEVTRLLLDKGANYSATTIDGLATLNLAITEKHLEIVRLLLDFGVSSTLPDESGWTPLGAAVCEGSDEIVELLLSRGATSSLQHQNSGWNPLDLATGAGHINIMRTLFEHGAEFSKLVANGWSPLSQRAETNRDEVFNFLIDKGFDVSATSQSGWTPLAIASREGLPERVAVLISKGADVLITNNQGETPMNLAAFKGHTEVAKLLFQAGADFSSPDNDGWTPLNNAASGGHLDVFRLLLEWGADALAPTKRGWTPLHSSAYSGSIDIAKILLEKGADISLRAKDDDTPLDAAVDGNNPDAVRLLLEHGASIHPRGVAKATCLHNAICRGREECAASLIQGGADLYEVDIYGRSGLDWIRVLALDSSKHLKTMVEGLKAFDLKRDIRQLTDKIREISRSISSGAEGYEGYHFYHLGQCFLFLGMLEDAFTAFQLNIDRGESLDFKLGCDLCRQSPIKNSEAIWACQVCRDTHFCSNCAKDRSKKEINLVCRGHDFLHVPAPAENQPSQEVVAEKLSFWQNLEPKQVPKYTTLNKENF